MWRKSVLSPRHSVLSPESGLYPLTRLSTSLSLTKGFKSLHEGHKEENKGHEDRHQRFRLGHPGLWPPVTHRATGFAGDGMSVMGQVPFALFVRPQGVFVLFVEIFFG